MLNKSFKKKNGKQFNFIHNDFKFLTLLQIFRFKIFGLTQGIYFFLFYQLFLQKKRTSIHNLFFKKVDYY